jgi:hypothetical protein
MPISVCPSSVRRVVVFFRLVRPHARDVFGPRGEKSTTVVSVFCGSVFDNIAMDKKITLSRINFLISKIVDIRVFSIEGVN